jgi:hypothetical protein
MASVQRSLFHELRCLPEGFRYEEELLSQVEERALMSTFERLTFREFEFRGFVGKRRMFPSAGGTTSMCESCNQRRQFRPSCWLYVRRLLSLPASPKTAFNTRWLLSIPPELRLAGIKTVPNSRWGTMPVSLPPQTEHVLGACIYRTPTSLSIPSPGSGPLGMAAQHPTR